MRQGSGSARRRLGRRLRSRLVQELVHLGEAGAGDLQVGVQLQCALHRGQARTVALHLIPCDPQRGVRRSGWSSSTSR